MIEELKALAERLSAPRPVPLPLQATRAAEAMAGKVDDENRRRWQERQDLATQELVRALPAILSALSAVPVMKEALGKIQAIASKPTYPGNNCRDIDGIARQALAALEGK